jgi:cytochrome c
MTFARFLAGPLFAAVPFCAFAETSATLGEQVFRRNCNSCHAIACNKSMGPKLGGLFGRKAGTVKDFGYSPEMANSGMVWTERTLDAFLANAPEVIPGNRMGSVAILRNAEDRRNVIAWLKREDTSLDICF